MEAWLIILTREKLLKMLKEAYEKGLETGIHIKRDGIYEGELGIIREAERILRER